MARVSKVKVLKAQIARLENTVRLAQEQTNNWQATAGQRYSDLCKLQNALQSAKWNADEANRHAKQTRETYEREIGALGLRLVAAETERDLYRNKLNQVTATIVGALQQASEPQVAVVKDATQYTGGTVRDGGPLHGKSYRPPSFA